MLFVAGKRSVCSSQPGGKENPEGCARCQLARPAATDNSTYLLLGPPNGNARQALINALEAASIPYLAWGGVLALPALRERISGVIAVFLQALPEATAADVRGTFFSGNLDDPGSALAAFVRAEPLSKLKEQAQHEWVRDAIGDDWLFSLFHPIVQADSEAVFAYEALIRARNPKTQEIIGAGPLINAAVKLNIEHVFDQRARQTAIRNAAALQMPQVRLFINFMPNTIYDPEVCLRTTMEAVEECGMQISDLVFEVVETEHIPDMKRLHKILDYYRERGAGTAVDDMGAGFSSLEYLTALRPNYVKLDRDLVVRAEHNSSAHQNLEMIIHQAKQLDIKVIAEGIETESQRQMCQIAGADFLQGFLFGQPANPPQAVRPLLRLLSAA